MRKGSHHTEEARAKNRAARLGALCPRLNSTEEAGPHDLIWAAGFYEGDGCAYGARGYAQVQVTQKDPWVLERLKALFGGSISSSGASSAYWQWCLFGARARGFLMSIYELLSPRRQEQIRKALGQ